MSTNTYQPGSGGVDVCITDSSEVFAGDDVTFVISNSQRLLMKFDISDIGSANICSSAILSLYTGTASNMHGKTYTAYSILSVNSGWNENATWNTKDGSNSWAGSAGCNTSGTDFNGTAIGSCVMNDTWQYANQFSLDPSVITTWFGVSNSNYGILIKHSNLNSGVLYSSDETTYTTKRPKLVVDYALGSSKFRRTFSPLGSRTGSRQPTQ